jgi:hypothetical protein
MKQGETQKYAHFLKKLSSEDLEKLLSTVLKEMRRRDSDLMKGDVMASTKALCRVRTCE